MTRVSLSQKCKIDDIKDRKKKAFEIILIAALKVFDKMQYKFMIKHSIFRSRRSFFNLIEYLPKKF